MGLMVDTNVFIRFEKSGKPIIGEEGANDRRTRFDHCGHGSLS